MAHILGGAGMAEVIGMHLVGHDSVPGNPLRGNLRPERVAVADDRKPIMRADFAVPLLRVAAALMHHEELHHGGLIGLLENLADQAFERFCERLGIAVIDAILHDNKVGLVHEKVASDAQRAEVGAGRTDAGVDERDLRFGKGLVPQAF